MQLSGSRIKSSGRIVGGACAEHPAFSASYDLVTDENGVTRRLSVRTTLASGEKHMSISRSGEGIWMVDNGTQHQRSAFGGALDVDVILSPFFNALPSMIVTRGPPRSPAPRIRSGILSPVTSDAAIRTPPVNVGS